MKRRIYALIVAIALTVAMTGAGSIVADALGFAATPQIHACSGNGHGGGGC